MSEPQPYFDDSGASMDRRAHFVSPVHDIAPRLIYPGLRFRPIATRDVMTSFVWFEPGAPAPRHHHSEQQISICLSGELTFTVAGETRAVRAGDCVVIPPFAEHEAIAGPDGAHIVDIFTPPREAMLQYMTPELFLGTEPPR